MTHPRALSHTAAQKSEFPGQRECVLGAPDATALCRNDAQHPTLDGVTNSNPLASASRTARAPGGGPDLGMAGREQSQGTDSAVPCSEIVA